MADVLVIHDNAPVRLSLLDALGRSDLRPLAAVDFDHARASASHDVAIVLMSIPAGMPTPTAIRRAKMEWPAAEVIVVGHSQKIGDATDAVRHGAFDYLSLPVDPAGLGQLVRHAAHGAVDRTRSQREWRGRAEGLDDPAADSVDPCAREVFARADRAATVDSTVLITGESGTGKEVLARRIHRRSVRSRRRFVPVNCASLPESLIETELFGYKKGAFTGANVDTKGLVEQAEGGILFLDEIGDMPLATQVRLLRFLDRHEIRAVGSTSIKYMDVRIIAATNRCLEQEVSEKRFREDLFFRLSVVPLHLPPLRERKADIPPLVHHHVRQAAIRLSVSVPAIDELAMSRLLSYDWPGNIRELVNAMEYALVQSSSARITEPDLPPTITDRPRTFAVPARAETGAAADLLATLQQHQGNIGHTAAALGISRTTLWRRLRQVHAATSAQSAAASATRWPGTVPVRADIG